MTHSRKAIAALAAAVAVVVLSAGRVRAQDHAQDEPDLRLHPDSAADASAKAEPPAAVIAAPHPGPAAEGGFGRPVPWGFYRDAQGRVMQVSFDFGRRLWLGVGYAPHRTPSGATEISPAAFDFG